MTETKEQKDERRLALYSEMGSFLGPIVERETLKDRARATDCFECILTHAIELLHTHYGLEMKHSKILYKNIQKEIQNYIIEIQHERKEKANE
jgi:hypothetical protein